MIKPPKIVKFKILNPQKIVLAYVAGKIQTPPSQPAIAT